MLGAGAIKTMKILIAGGGKVGATLTRQLSIEGYDLTLIDSKQRVLDAVIEKYDINAVNGNCASMQTLEAAGVQDADLLIAATGEDEVNLLAAMTAHGMNPKIHTIARIRDPEYALQAYVMRDVFGLSMAFNPERQTAVEVARLLQYPGFLKRDSFARGKAEIVELKIEETSKLCNTPLSDLYKTVRCKILVCAVLRDGEAITPSGDFVLREGDRIFVTASSRDLSVLLNNLGIVTRKIKSLMVFGGGRVSYYLAAELAKSGVAIKIIESDADRCRELAEQLPEVTVIQGDAADHSLLESEGLSECDAMAALTGIDELNLLMSIYAKQIGVPHVITKLGRSEHLQMVDSLPLDSVVCPKELCAADVVRYVRAMKDQVGAAITLHSIADGKSEAIEFLVDENTLNCGRPLKDIKTKSSVLIVCKIHRGKIEIPNGETSYEVGDTLVVVSNTSEVIHHLNDIFES